MNNKNTHSGETISGVTVQMRFIPLKTDPDDKKNDLTATISVRVDNTQSGTPDNLLELTLPKITKLNGEGETFIRNKIKLITTIFEPKGWNKPEHISKRLDKYALFMTNQATTDFCICLRHARDELLSRITFKDPTRLIDLKTKQDEFLEWLKETRTLTRLGYANKDCDTVELKSAFTTAVNRYERAIEYHMGKQLWKKHQHAFRLHKKYFCNHLRKPFSMSIIDFTNRMKEYGELLRHLPAPSARRCTNSNGARWDEVSLTDREIRCAIYDALPPDYQIYLRSNTIQDWQESNDQEFLDALMNCKRIDQSKRLRREQEKERKKLISQRFIRREDIRRPGRMPNKEGEKKRPYAKMSGNTRQSSPNNRKFCQHCKDSDGKWWTHNTDECYFKKPRKEVNAIEAVHKEIDDLKGLIKSLKKKVDSDDDDE